MASKSLKKLIALVTMGATLCSTTLANAAIVTDNSKNDSSSSDVSYDSFDENSDGVLKVNVDDNGNVSYQTPVGKTALEVESEKGKWGDKVYDENRTFSWDDVNMYFVMTDRFVNGDSSNDHSYGRGLDGNGNPVENYDTRCGNFHGGDLKGLTSKIEDGYFDNLGTNAIWITAPYEQIHGALSAGGFKHYGYEGYYVLDYTEVDKNMGTEDDLEKFIDTAHSHGIRVVFDIVMNHAGYANPVDAAEFKYGGLNPNWKDIYYQDETKLQWWNDYDVEAKKNGGDASKGMLLADADWTNFWGSNWVRMTVDQDGTHRFGSYSPTGVEDSGDEKTYCSKGLPDFVTEGTDDPGMPVFYNNKWSAEKMAKQKEELDAFCKENGMNKCVKTYLCKWLSDWVEKYGVDGFRCDTAKHVGLDCWADLKKASSNALKKWRTNNPNKPGANWTDDFWMTGEHWNHGVGKDAYYTNGFDSMINFTFPKDGNASESALEGLYSGYAKSINSDPTFNVLSYVSSHDTVLGARSASEGTALLLAPGGVQTFYGDETGRQADSGTEGQNLRSNMNWDSIDENILSNWQKIGQFRSEHIAVGAGAHKKLNGDGEPYSFSRIYHEGQADEDKVVVSLPGAGGEQVVNCGDTFEDGTTLIDYYTGKDYDVSGGKVTVEADDSGVVLLSQGKPSTKASISASCKDAKNGIYYGDTTSVTLSLKKAATGTYSIDGGSEKSFKDGDTITIGENAKAGDVTRIQLKATGSDDPDKQEIVKEFDYIKSEKDSGSSTTENGLIVHAKNTKWADQSKMNIWVYDATTKKNAVEGAEWPGEAMTKDDNGWFTTSYPAVKTPQCIILSNLPDRSVPDQQDDVPQSGEVWYLDGKWYTSNPEKLSISSFTADQYKVAKGTDVKLTAKATGSGDISYEFFDGDESIGTSDDGTITWTPDKDATYKIKVVATDANEGTQSATMTYVVGEGGQVDPPQPNKFDIKSLTSNADNDTITVGDTAVITAETENADGDVQYKFEAEDGEKQDYSDSSTFEFTPKNDGAYKVTVTAKDNSGKEVTKDISITVNKIEQKKDLSVTLSADKNQMKVGETATFTAKPSNATGDVQYQFSVNGKLSQKYSSDNTFKFTPQNEGNYIVTVKVKDDNNKEVSAEKSMKVDSKDAVQQPVMLDSFVPDKASPQVVNTPITLKATTEDGVGNITYTFYIDGEEVQSGLESAYVWTPKEAKDYELKVTASDELGAEDTKNLTYTVNQQNSESNQFSASIKADKETAVVGDTVTFTLSTKNADDDVTYTVTIDGDKQTVNGNKVVWTPVEKGSFDVEVTAQCGDNRATTSMQYKVSEKAGGEGTNNTGDSRNVVALGVLGTMGLGYVLANRKKKKLN